MQLLLGAGRQPVDLTQIDQKALGDPQQQQQQKSRLHVRMHATDDAVGHVLDIEIFMQTDRDDVAFHDNDAQWQRRILQRIFIIGIFPVFRARVVDDDQRLVLIVIVIDVRALLLIQ